MTCHGRMTEWNGNINRMKVFRRTFDPATGRDRSRPYSRGLFSPIFDPVTFDAAFHAPAASDSITLWKGDGFHSHPLSRNYVKKLLSS